MKIKLKGTKPSKINAGWEKTRETGSRAPSQLGTSRKDFAISRKDFGISRNNFRISRKVFEFSQTYKSKTITTESVALNLGIYIS